jgi:catalase
MSGLVPETMQKVAHAALGPRQGDKLKDLAHDTRDMTPKDRLTTDYGVKQSTADDWLKAASSDKTGPLLLEDPFARERVRMGEHLVRKGSNHC